MQSKINQKSIRNQATGNFFYDLINVVGQPE
jgi:hypothetical protein